jgi:type II secretory pathway component PulF
MTNPSSVVSEEPSSSLVPRSAALMVACWLLCATLLACAVIATIGTAQFEQVFSSFGADVPALTMLFLKARYLWWLLPTAALTLALWVTGKKQHHKRTQTKITIGFVVLFLVSILLVSAAVFAMYLPIFNLGKPVA